MRPRRGARQPRGRALHARPDPAREAPRRVVGRHLLQHAEVDRVGTDARRRAGLEAHQIVPAGPQAGREMARRRLPLPPGRPLLLAVPHDPGQERAGAQHDAGRPQGPPIRGLDPGDGAVLHRTAPPPRPARSPPRPSTPPGRGRRRRTRRARSARAAIAPRAPCWRSAFARGWPSRRRAVPSRPRARRSRTRAATSRARRWRGCTASRRSCRGSGAPAPCAPRASPQRRSPRSRRDRLRRQSRRTACPFHPSLSAVRHGAARAVPCRHPAPQPTPRPGPALPPPQRVPPPRAAARAPSDRSDPAPRPARRPPDSRLRTRPRDRPRGGFRGLRDQPPDRPPASDRLRP